MPISAQQQAPASPLPPFLGVSKGWLSSLRASGVSVVGFAYSITRDSGDHGDVGNPGDFGDPFSHSLRNAINGSTFVTRRAGT